MILPNECHYVVPPQRMQSACRSKWLPADRFHLNGLLAALTASVCHRWNAFKRPVSPSRIQDYVSDRHE
jgi:hypothetical protein